MNDESSAAVAIVKSPENPVSPIFDYFVSSPFSFDYTAIWDAAEWKHPETRQRNSLAPSLPPTLPLLFFHSLSDVQLVIESSVDSCQFLPVTVSFLLLLS